jgi:hypothetical protein
MQQAAEGLIAQLQGRIGCLPILTTHTLCLEDSRSMAGAEWPGWRPAIRILGSRLVHLD